MTASYAWVNANQKLPRAYFDLSVAAMEDYRRLAQPGIGHFTLHA